MGDDSYTVASEDDLTAAVDNAIRESGCTAAELKQQGISGDFVSIKARLAWVAIGDLLPDGYMPDLRALARVQAVLDREEKSDG